MGGKRNSAGMELLPFTRAILGRPALGRAKVEHLVQEVRKVHKKDGAETKTYLGGNDVELELLPVVVGLFER